MENLKVFGYVYLFETIRMFIVLGLFYMLFLLCSNWAKKNKIQKNKKKSKLVLKIERFNAIKTLAIFAIGGVLTNIGITLGYFKFYINNDNYSLFYTISSFFLLVILQDAYFYWTHRLLHTKLFFKKFHLVHHKSLTPSPISSYNFSWLEAFILYGIGPLYMFFLPLNIITFHLFMLYALVKDAQAHSGVEFFPKWWVDSPLDFFATTTHHDLHHQNGSSNYGLHFTMWDRLMKTENKDYKKKFREVKNAE